MSNPFAWLHRKHWGKAFAGSALAAVAVFAVIGLWNRPLQTPAAPNGIVSLELANTPAAAQAMLDAWTARARLFAGLSLGIDYLFMVLYAVAIGLGCVLVGAQHRGRVETLGHALAWGMFAAAALDAVENAALIHMLTRGAAAMPWPRVAATCATVKFALVAAGLAFVLVGGAAIFTQRTHHHAN